tara:strand:+ start:2141 stop:2893 length:753 start_codon:yes stop_codon:yes gene_type:complete
MIDDKIPGFITVRTSSTRLPNKCFLPFGERCNVLQHIIRRSKHYNIEPIVCTSTDSSDDLIENTAKKEGVKYFRGSLVNKLKRWADCASHFNINAFHTIDADDPFFDGNEIKISMKKLSDGNFDVITPTESSNNGGGSVGYSLKSNIIKKALERIDKDTDTEMMWVFLEKVKNVKVFNLPENFHRPKKLRLTLDFEEDYHLLKFVQNILGCTVERKKVDDLFFNNPDLHKINWFRNSQWKELQNDKIKKT